MAAALPACYHGAITRKECEELLGRKNKEGAYLIRDSETIQGALCLCVYKQKIVYTYRVLQTHTGSYTLLTAGGLQETFFKTLDELIVHYRRRNQGLAIHLRHSVKRKTPLLIGPSRPVESKQDRRPDLGPDPGPASRPNRSPGRSPVLHRDLGPDGPAQEDLDPDYENVSEPSEYVEVLPD